MSIDARLRMLESRWSRDDDAEDLRDRERRIAELCRAPVGDPATEARRRQQAKVIVAGLMQQENPDDLHYPPCVATTLCNRYGIDLVAYAVNDRHAEMLRRFVP